MSNKHGNVIYIGVTDNIMRRVAEHKTKVMSGFTATYNCNCLIYYEEFRYIREAILREKTLKSWARWKKERLIKTLNPERIDLAAEWEF